MDIVEHCDLLEKCLKGDKQAARAIFKAVGQLEGEVGLARRAGWQECLDHLGAPNSEAAPMERAALLLEAMRHGQA